MYEAFIESLEDIFYQEEVERRIQLEWLLSKVWAVIFVKRRAMLVSCIAKPIHWLEQLQKLVWSEEQLWTGILDEYIHCKGLYKQEVGLSDIEGSDIELEGWSEGQGEAEGLWLQCLRRLNHEMFHLVSTSPDDISRLESFFVIDCGLHGHQKSSWKYIDVLW